MAEVVKLTDAERLVLWRRAGAMTREDAAEQLGVTLYRYRRWESGSETPSAPVRFMMRRGVARPTAYEAAFILRRRRGVTQAGLAKKLGVSRQWLGEMELGKVPGERLLAYWEVVP